MPKKTLTAEVQSLLPQKRGRGLIDNLPADVIEELNEIKKTFLSTPAHGRPYKSDLANALSKALTARGHAVGVYTVERWLRKNEA